MRTWERYCCLTSFLLGEEASPSIGNTLWRVSTMFTRSAITPPEVNGFGWHLENSEYIDRFWARSAQKRERETLRIFCFLARKQCSTLPISGQQNFTKFAHKTWFYDAVNPFGNIFFLNLPLRGFFPKNRDHRQRFSTSSGDFSEMITNLGKSWQVGAPMECWFSIRTVGINSKSFAWPAGSVWERTFLDIGGSSV